MLLDESNTSVGFRSLRFSADTGFHLNEQHFKVRGCELQLQPGSPVKPADSCCDIAVCDHNSFASVGTAVPERVNLFRANAARSVGGNARRMSHNPPDPSMLDIYDRVGMVVMDENRLFAKRGPNARRGHLLTTSRSTGLGDPASLVPLLDELPRELARSRRGGQGRSPLKRHADCKGESAWAHRCASLWQEIETGRVDLGDYVSEIRKVPAALVCDCKSFFDAVNARESAGLGMRDKRSAIETLAIRNSCRETETPVLWVHSDAQIADGLTKGKVSFRLEEFFGAHAQIWRVIFDTVTLSARRRKVLGPGPLDEIAGSSPRDSECNSEI